MGELRRVRVRALVEANDCEQQQTSHKNADGGDDHQDQPVQHVNAFRQFSCGRLETQTAVGRLTNGFKTFLRCGWKA